MNPTYSFLLAVALCICCDCSKKFPSYLTICHRTDPELEACFRRAVEQLRPHLVKGIPELLIPPMDPLVLPQAGLDNGNNFKASFKNIEIYHANEFKIDLLKVDLENAHLELVVGFSRLRIKSQYNIDGRILILQLQGHGPADGNFTNVIGKLNINGSRYLKNGKEYLTFNDQKLELNLGKPVFQFDNIFRDNKELNDQTNKIINENVEDIIDELRPVIDKTITQFAFGLVSRIFDRFSFDELFPE